MLQPRGSRESSEHHRDLLVLSLGASELLQTRGQVTLKLMQKIGESGIPVAGVVHKRVDGQQPVGSVAPQAAPEPLSCGQPQRWQA